MTSLGPNQDTLLVIHGLGGMPRWAARGLSQSLTPIAATQQVARTVNGRLVSLAQPQFMKYSTVISCKDQRLPAFDGIFPGFRVFIHCVAELCYPVGGTPSRPMASGYSRTEGEFVFYRPILECLITAGPEIAVDEWPADVDWEITAEEI